MTTNNVADRSEAVVAAIVPRSVRVRRYREDRHSICLKLNGRHIKVKWLGEGGLRQARELIASRKNLPEVAVARRMSPGARKALSAAGVGWADETGAAEIALGTLIVSRSGRPSEAPRKPPRWTPSVLAVAEALLCGGKATVSVVQETTGLSVGSATNALRVLTDLGLLTASARRGRSSGRSVSDQDRLLDDYAAAAGAMMPAIALTVGVTWRDLAAGLSQTGHQWTSTGIPWAATGSVAALMLAPYLTAVTTGELYIDRETISGTRIRRRASGPATDGGWPAHPCVRFRPLQSIGWLSCETACASHRGPGYTRICAASAYEVRRPPSISGR